MTSGTGLVLLGAFAAALAASAWFLERSEADVDPLALEVDGIGPLRLGRGFEAAMSAARLAAPETAWAGAGCSGRDEITYSGSIGALPVTVMAMADEGVITEIEMTMDAPRNADNEAACLALRAQLGAHLVARFGAEGPGWVVRKPVSSEHLSQVGPVVLGGRWFLTGKSCYITASYGTGKRG